MDSFKDALKTLATLVMLAVIVASAHFALSPAVAIGITIPCSVIMLVIAESAGAIFTGAIALGLFAAVELSFPEKFGGQVGPAILGSIAGMMFILLITNIKRMKLPDSKATI